MFRCWILHIPLCLLWQPHYTMAFSFIVLMISLFHFSFEDRASLLQPLRGRLLSGLFEDYRWHVLSADAWFTLGLHDLYAFRNE